MTQSAEKIGTDLKAIEEVHSRDSGVHSETPAPDAAESGENVIKLEKIAGEIAENVAGTSEIEEDKLTRRPPKLGDLEAFIEKSLSQPKLPAVTTQTPPDDSPSSKNSGTMEPERK